MAHPLWPLFDLKVRTGPIELRLPTDDDIVALAAVALKGIHPPDEMPFAVPWTDLPSPEFEHGFARYHWAQRGNIAPAAWALDFGVFHDGVPAGMQELRATDFVALRTVRTGSWLGREFQGRGIGRLMRQAVLALGFDHLGAEVAESGAFADNRASLRVSEHIGYLPNGVERVAPRGSPREMRRFRLTLDGWRSRPRPDVVVEGLEPCLPLLGLAGR
jgi:RimJ/RimL family protein N-acetyltransferase